MPEISLPLFHFIQVWLALDVIAGLWFAYEVQTTGIPYLPWHD